MFKFYLFIYLFMMILLFIRFLEILKKFWLFINFLLIISTLIRKADDESLNSLRIPFLSSSKKSEKFVDNFIWILISIYLVLGLIFSTKYFS
uniref:hypothetical protein n=1 Tax=Vacuolaria virescens TaxID=44451 RepID=UPI00211405C4|nr:hypothetical protein NQY37_pgp049 [Vacuolaria virescens]UTE94752.1 hypothetical protein VvirPt_p137 [Vacuolaria virescens]